MEKRMRFREVSALGGVLASAALLMVSAPLAAQQQPAAGGQPAAGQQGAQQGPAQPRVPARQGLGRSTAQLDWDNHEGWTNIFDGTSLASWEGMPGLWQLDTANKVVWAESTCEKPVGSTYMYWKGGEPGDFELRYEMKVEGAVNSGFQYRSYINVAAQQAAAQPRPPAAAPAGGAAPGGAAPGGGGGGGGGFGGNQGPCPSGQPRGVALTSQPGNLKWAIGGPQFDFDYNNMFTGQNYEGGTGRGIIAWRGDVVRTETGKKPRLISSVGDNKELAGYIHVNDWNQLQIIARGNVLIHIMNGHVLSILVDDDASVFRPRGLLALQIEATGKTSYRNIWLKQY
jgi:hypothetical protein